MKTIETLSAFVPIIKINNRALNLDFYTKTLGLKLLHEENAFADLGGLASSDVKIILEESPSMRTRQVMGPKKLAQLVLKAAVPEEIEELLSLGANYQDLYCGPKGWAFSALSPEGDLVLLHSEENREDLEIFNGKPTFQKGITEFAGLSAFDIEEISVRTPDVVLSQTLLKELLGQSSPLTFIAGEGPDLQVANDLTWDLAGAEVQVTPSTDFNSLKDLAQSKKLAVFLDAKKRFLVLTGPNGLEITLRK